MKSKRNGVALTKYVPRMFCQTSYERAIFGTFKPENAAVPFFCLSVRYTLPHRTIGFDETFQEWFTTN